MELSLLTHNNTAGEAIARALTSGKYSEFKAAVAYSRNSGISRMYNELSDFANRGGKTSIITGIDQGNTSYQALVNLKTFAKDNPFIHHDRNFEITFHPKVYLFGNNQVEKVIIGSSNFTAGGFYLNYEANIGVTLDNCEGSDNFQKQISSYWDNLLHDENTRRLETPLLEKLLQSGSIADEQKQKPFKEIIAKVSIDLPFKARSRITSLPPAIGTPANFPAVKNRFAMTLSGFDVSDNSQDPVVLIPIKALREVPSFWNFPNLYTYSGGGYPQLYATANVNIDNHTYAEHIRIYYYDNKSEFRLQCEPIKRKGQRGDIFIISKDPNNPLEFEIELVRASSDKFKEIKPKLTNRASPQKDYAYY